MSKRWKQLERDTAEALGGERVQRDLYESAPDVLIHDLGWLCECKAYKAFRHHSLLETAQAKYAENGEQVVLVTREPGQQAYTTVPLSLLSRLVNVYRNHKETNQ